MWMWLLVWFPCSVDGLTCIHISVALTGIDGLSKRKMTWRLEGTCYGGEECGESWKVKWWYLLTYFTVFMYEISVKIYLPFKIKTWKIEGKINFCCPSYCSLKV